MNKMEKKQFVKVVNNKGDETKVAFYAMDDIHAVSYFDNFYLLINDSGILTDLLTGDMFVENNKKLVVEPFRQYILNNISLFDKEIVDMAYDVNCNNESTLDCNDFINRFDKIKNKVFDYSNRDIKILEDGTTIETTINTCDRSSLLDKLVSLDGVSEESIIALLCDLDACFETKKTIVKNKDGKVLTDSFIIRNGEHIIINDCTQLFYDFNVLGFCKRKSITCQNDMDKYIGKEFKENYLNVLKISMENEKYNSKIYK